MMFPRSLGLNSFLHCLSRWSCNLLLRPVLVVRHWQLEYSYSIWRSVPFCTTSACCSSGVAFGLVFRSESSPTEITWFELSVQLVLLVLGLKFPFPSALFILFWTLLFNWMDISGSCLTRKWLDEFMKFAELLAVDGFGFWRVFAVTYSFSCSNADLRMSFTVAPRLKHAKFSLYVRESHFCDEYVADNFLFVVLRPSTFWSLTC